MHIGINKFNEINEISEILYYLQPGESEYYFKINFESFSQTLSQRYWKLSQSSTNAHE